MLNQTSVVTKSYSTRKTILIDEKNSTALSCIVSNTGVEANKDGKKIIKAGTPVSGDLTKRDVAFTVAKNVSSGEGSAATTTNNAIGIILHDVDVTGGEANSQVVIFGTIDIGKLDSDVVSLLTDAAKANMKMIQFAK